MHGVSAFKSLLVITFKLKFSLISCELIVSLGFEPSLTSDVSKCLLEKNFFPSLVKLNLIGLLATSD